MAICLSPHWLQTWWPCVYLPIVFILGGHMSNSPSRQAFKQTLPRPPCQCSLKWITGNVLENKGSWCDFAHIIHPVWIGLYKYGACTTTQHTAGSGKRVLCFTYKTRIGVHSGSCVTQSPRHTRSVEAWRNIAAIEQQQACLSQHTSLEACAVTFKSRLILHSCLSFHTCFLFYYTEIWVWNMQNLGYWSS